MVDQSIRVSVYQYFLSDRHWRNMFGVVMQDLRISTLISAKNKNDVCCDNFGRYFQGGVLVTEYFFS